MAAELRGTRTDRFGLREIDLYMYADGDVMRWLEARRYGRTPVIVVWPGAPR